MHNTPEGPVGAAASNPITKPFKITSTIEKSNGEAKS
jgi:hypothetical protein